MPPKTDGSGNDRAMLRRPSTCSRRPAGQQKGGKLVNDEGETLDFEFLINASVFERVLSPWVANLKRIGVTATIRQVDSAQYQSRLNDYDFDVILAALHARRDAARRPQPVLRLQGRRHSRDRTTTPASSSKAVDGLLDRLPGVDEPRRAGHAAEGARPGAARRTIRHAELVSGRSPGRPLGHLRLAGEEAGLRLHAGDDLVVRRRQGGGNRLQRVGSDIDAALATDPCRCDPPSLPGPGRVAPSAARRRVGSGRLHAPTHHAPPTAPHGPPSPCGEGLEPGAICSPMARGG